jgi:hypothetical protein
VTAAVSRDNLGAWLVKCDPDVWDLPSFVEDGGEYISDWSIQDNYRSRLMEPGDAVILWVSGRKPGYPRGIWGLGHITGPAEDSATRLDRDTGDDEISYWLDEEARLAVRCRVPVHILLFTTPVAARDLPGAGIYDLEVQRMPQGSNPSWVSRDQLANLRALLPHWPEQQGETRELVVTERGAGFGDALQNRVVEKAAMDAVSQVYGADGWDVEDVSRQKTGWDLTCTHKDGRIAKVEVKGVSGQRPCVLLTPNEVRTAKTEEDWVLAVVTRALRAPEVIEFTGGEAVAAARPYVYRADLMSEAK